MANILQVLNILKLFSLPLGEWNDTKMWETIV